MSKHTPQAGCTHLETWLGDATVTIEYEITFGSPGRTYGPPEKCYESTPDECVILQVLINDVWIDPDGVICESTIDRWTQEAIDDANQRSQDASDDAEIARFESMREAA
jgi:hypothetical protein